MEDNKPSIKTIIGGILIVLLSIIIGFFSLYGTIISSTVGRQNISPVLFIILFVNLLMFISGILMSWGAKRAWKLFLFSAIIIVIGFIILNL